MGLLRKRCSGCAKKSDMLFPPSGPVRYCSKCNRANSSAARSNPRAGQPSRTQPKASGAPKVVESQASYQSRKLMEAKARKQNGGK